MFIRERMKLITNAVVIKEGDNLIKFLTIITAINKNIATCPKGHILNPYSFPMICLNQSLFFASIPAGRKLKSIDVLKI